MEPDKTLIQLVQWILNLEIENIRLQAELDALRKKEVQ